MFKFLIKIIVYSCVSLLLLLIGLFTSSYNVEKRGFKNSQTESNTLFLKENESYDVLLLGISHARNFSRYGNHERIETILNKKIVNLGQGSGNCSINEQLFYLDYFYKTGNSTKQVCIVLTPPMLSSETLPVASNTFNKEKFSISFFTNYLWFQSENKKERMVNYLQSKFSKEWLQLKPDNKIGNFMKLQYIDSSKINSGMQLAYGEQINFVQFHQSCVQVESIIQLAQKNNSKVLLFIPPALFGKWKEHIETFQFLKKVEKRYNCKVEDYSVSVTIPEFYYDHHHLNTNGVIYFTENFLKPFFNE